MESKPKSTNIIPRQLQIGVLVAVVFVAGMLFGSQGSMLLAQNDRTQLSQDVEAEFEPLFETFNLIQQQYIEEIPVTELVDGAIRGMVEVLDDPYSNYVDAENFPFVDSNLSGEIEGIGVVITENEDTGEIEVVNVMEGTPAEGAGLQEGDVFVIVNGEDAIGWTFLELAARVRGPSGTTVDITMRRDGELIDFTVERARIEIPNIETDLLEGNIGYVRMAQFTSNARDQVNAAIQELNAQQELNGLILDLRGNPGGLLSAATEVAGLFLEEGVILTEEFGDGRVNTFEIRDGAVYEVFDTGNERVYSNNAGYFGLDIPVVVLVNQTSASASELVAGTWQDSGTVTVIGTVTFGKGSVQIQNTLVNGGGVRLTVARWLTPNGVWISEQGVTPDFIVEIPEDYELAEGEDPQLEAALEFLATGDVTINLMGEEAVGQMEME